MTGSWRLLDRILRGEATRPTQLQEGRLTFPVAGLSTVAVVLAMIYGACLGCYSIFRVLDQPGYVLDFRQMLASAVKMPALFLLTLLITFPSLYVFNALVGSRLTFTSVLRLLIAAIGVNLAVLASLGPIVAFFSLSTSSYGFMVLLNVAVCAVSGVLGLMFLVQTLDRLQRAQEAAAALALDAAADMAPSHVVPTIEGELPATPPAVKAGALDRLHDQPFRRPTRTVFAVWIIVFSLVGAQMGWILRPFVGHPAMEFQWLRPRQSNFFEAVSTTFFNLMAGSSRTDADPEREPPPSRDGVRR